MARKRRVWNPIMYEHVITRGNNRREIFHQPADYAAFFRALDYAHQKYAFTIISYCIMTNHYHLLIRSPEVPLGKIMAHVNKRYGDYYRKKYNYTGYLYEGRYYAEKVNGPTGLLAVSRYIHRNPIKTATPMVEKMEHYPYSSCAFYVYSKPAIYPFTDFGQLIHLLPAPYARTSIGYLQYCEAPDEEEANCTGDSHPHNSHAIPNTYEE